MAICRRGRVRRHARAVFVGRRLLLSFWRSSGGRSRIQKGETPSSPFLISSKAAFWIWKAAYAALLRMRSGCFFFLCPAVEAGGGRTDASFLRLLQEGGRGSCCNPEQIKWRLCSSPLSSAGTAALSSPPSRRSSELGAGARRLVVTKWCVPGDFKLANVNSSSPEMRARASASLISASLPGGHR